jgi:hypothetical protein
VAQQGLTFGRLEPCDGKLSSAVLRGLGAGNSPRLPGNRESAMSIKFSKFFFFSGLQALKLSTVHHKPNSHPWSKPVILVTD